MITKTTNTIAFLKNLWLEIFLNKTDKVSDISDNSVLNAIAFGSAKTAQKAIKDIAIIEAKIFPDTASGAYLDTCAELFGVSQRKGALGSTTYMRVYANVGTVYSGCTFVSTNGIRFEMEEPSVTIGSSGYTYIGIKSTSTGSITNVEAGSILTVTPQPVGHIACINEYYAIGGRDEEDDETFRVRIKNGANKEAMRTIEYLTQLLQDIDSRILRVVNVGLSETGKTTIAVLTQNGVVLTDNELTTILDSLQSKLPIVDIDIYEKALGIALINASWFNVGGDTGIDFRCSLKDGYAVDTVRKEIQIALTKLLDFRTWVVGGKIYWTDIFDTIQSVTGVNFVSNENFYPNINQVVRQNQFPRIKSFVMRDLVGDAIYSSTDLAPIFYTR